MKRRKTTPPRAIMRRILAIYCNILPRILQYAAIQQYNILLANNTTICLPTTEQYNNIDPNPAIILLCPALSNIGPHDGESVADPSEWRSLGYGMAAKVHPGTLRDRLPGCPQLIGCTLAYETGSCCNQQCPYLGGFFTIPAIFPVSSGPCQNNLSQHNTLRRHCRYSGVFQYLV